ncbi:MAG: Cardiolipin synthetase [Candidatus Ozemobacter sibiricus]|uniref:Cardiolipin synthetase n=1 Tax=Candidatus Ozemobacter sibiricus TaxID=2268124 RepID=A0A367ZIE0_9BACT|nr:MAG: Cardiolipin synthetase [Candidatus Ozemobacter sibiricus]
MAILIGLLGWALTISAADLANLQRDWLARQEAYRRAVAEQREAAEIKRLAADLQRSWSAYRAALREAGGQTDLPESAVALTVETPDRLIAPSGTPSSPSSASVSQAEAQAFDALIARLYEPGRSKDVAARQALVKQYLATCRNPYFRMQATFELAALLAETPRGTEEAVKVLAEYARVAPTREAARLATARIAAIRQEAKVNACRQTFAAASAKAGQAWQTYARTSWLAIPAKLARLATYVAENHHRRTAARALRAELDRYDALAQETYPRHSLDQMTRSRLIPSNEITLLVNGRHAFAARHALIRQARERIWLQTLLFYNDETGNRLADLLIAKAREGLDVRVVADDAFAFTRKSSIFRKLQNGGVKVLINNPLLAYPLRANFRSHQKCLVIDEEAAIVGGMNIANEYANGEITEWGWRDTDVLVRGPAVYEIAEMFSRNWERLETEIRWEKGAPAPVTPKDKREKLPILPRREKLIPGPLPRYFEEPPSFANVRVRFITTAPIIDKDDNILDLFTSYMKASRREVIFETAYFIPTPALREAIVAACKRGVKVKILTNSVESNNHPNAGYAGRANYEAVMQAGAEIYEWQGAQTLHSKVSWFDGLAVTVGAYNVNSRSHALDSEDVLAIEDRRVAALMRKVLERDLARARRITPADLEAWRNDLATRVKTDFFSLFSWVF